MTLDSYFDFGFDEIQEINAIEELPYCVIPEMDDDTDDQSDLIFGWT